MDIPPFGWHSSFIDMGIICRVPGKFWLSNTFLPRYILQFQQCGIRLLKLIHASLDSFLESSFYCSFKAHLSFQKVHLPSHIQWYLASWANCLVWDCKWLKIVSHTPEKTFDDFQPHIIDSLSSSLFLVANSLHAIVFFSCPFNPPYFYVFYNKCAKLVLIFHILYQLAQVFLSYHTIVCGCLISCSSYTRSCYQLDSTA